MKSLLTKSMRYLRVGLMILIVALFPFVPVFAMAQLRDRTRINVKGGSLWKTEVIASGGSATTMLDLGYLHQTSWKIDRFMQKITDEVGNTVHVISGGEDWEFTFQLKQTSIDEINFAKDDSFRHFYYKVKLSNGRFQEVYIPLAKVSSVVELAFQAPNERLLSVTITAIMPKGAVTVTPSGLNVPADAYGVIVENAAALGEVTTSTGTIYTAAV